MNALTLKLGKMLAGGALAFGLAVSAAQAQEIVPPGPNGRGALLIYGNFCGPGSRGPGYPPIDVLDQACAQHDACSPEGPLSSCSCNRRLMAQAGGVAQDPRASAKAREAAQFITGVMAALPCQ